MDLDIAEQVDVENLIIWGDALRVLLASDQISPGEINSTLKEKGVFIDGSDDSLTIPLLSHILLTPSEFERLISNAYKREVVLKTNTDSMTLTSDGDGWKGEVLTNIKNIVGGIKLGPGYHYLVEPRATLRDDGGVDICYKLERTDCSLDWISQRRVYEANIVLKRKKGSLEVEVLKGHTSKETDRVNSIISRGTTRLLKSKGVIKEDTPRGILFTDFSNEERVRFFLLMTGASDTSFQFEQLVDVDIVRDQTSGSLPADPEISWMENKVKKLHVNGEKLHEINLMTNKLFHKYCYLVRMNATYKYQYGLNEGTCSVTFWFGGKTAHDTDYLNTEFCTSVDRIGRFTKKSDKEIRAKIYESLGALRDSALKTIVEARS
jgi:hypothetical protein